MNVSKYEFTMELLAAMVAENIARKQKISKIKAFDRFIKSKTAQMLFNEETLLWHNGPDYIENEYYLEKK